tara:strand:+ start:659 stop:859 length:201 start_codon:yes stop_codon:yes gene_type:complete
VKTYEITIEYNETQRFSVKANNEEEAENKLLDRHSWVDSNKNGSEDVSFVDWIDGGQEIIDIKEVE